MAVKYPGKPLHVGAEGDPVRALQRQLGKYDLSGPLRVDGDYGPRTAQVVENFQRNRGLGSDGSVDMVMWHAIFRLAMPDLHPGRRENRAEKIRRLRVEQLERWRQRRRLKAGRRKRRVIKRQRRIGRALRQLVKPPETRPRVVGRNKIRGGKPGERVVFAAREALRRYQNGERPSFYSQPGWWTVLYALTGEPWGARSDCSQWVTSLFHACGLPDPNGGNFSGGWTGTLAAHGRQISRTQAYAEAAKGDHPVLVIWDAVGRQGHVEVLVSSRGDTIGHGSAPIAAHTVATFDYKPGGPKFYIYE